MSKGIFPNGNKGQFKKGMTPWNKGTNLSGMTGKKHSDKTKEKQSEAQTGEKNHSYGKSPSKETRQKQRESTSGEKSYLNGKFGEKHPAWKGDKCITPENRRIRISIDFRLWREAVFARDNYTCQKYGIKSGKLIAHHIQNFAQFPELRFAIDNGITLSDKAHRDFHKKYGFKNNTREQIMEFLNI